MKKLFSQLKKEEQVKQLMEICVWLGLEGKKIERNAKCGEFGVKILANSETYTFNQLNKLNKSRLMDLRNELMML